MHTFFSDRLCKLYSTCNIEYDQSISADTQTNRGLHWSHDSQGPFFFFFFFFFFENIQSWLFLILLKYTSEFLKRSTKQFTFIYISIKKCSNIYKYKFNNSTLFIFWFHLSILIIIIQLGTRSLRPLDKLIIAWSITCNKNKVVKTSNEHQHLKRTIMTMI